MDCCATPSNLLSLEHAIEKMLLAVTPITETETIDLTHAAGRINATPLISPMHVPSFNNSAMDGYAVRLHELRSGKPLPVAGKIFAGAPLQTAWPAESCLRIMTGAPIPDGCNAVVMQELVTITEQGVLFEHIPLAGQNIRHIGEDIAQHATVFPAGIKLGTAQLPLLASLGIVEVTVFRRLKVAIFSTGDELQPIGSSLKEGQIYDTNRFAVRLMLSQLGCEVIDLGIIPDNPDRLRATFCDADKVADLVISSGGVSVGEADYTKQILDEAGEINFWKLAIKPGKPFAFGKLQHAWFCGLPGNPVSATVTFYQLVQPLLAKLAGHSNWQAPRRFSVRCADALKKSPGRLDFQRGILKTDENGEMWVHSTGHQGSHIFSSFSEGDCFIVLAQERGAVAKGEWVDVEPFNLLLGA